MSDQFKEWTEDLSVAGGELRNTVERLLKDVTVHRLVVRKPNGDKFFELPAVIGVASGLLLWQFALVAVGIARLANYRIVVVRREQVSEEEEIEVVVEEIIEEGEFHDVDEMAEAADEVDEPSVEDEIIIMDEEDDEEDGFDFSFDDDDEDEIIIEDVADVVVEITPEPVPAPTPVVEATEKDDLTVIKGIGPKYDRFLTAEGIPTLAKLATADAEALRQKIADTGVRAIPDVESWIAQAQALANVAPEPEETVRPNDLSVIKGIGPKYRKLLAEAGIETWGQLAYAQPSDLRTILQEAGVRAIPNVALWTEQAKLAAGGKWDALERMQEKI